MHEEVGLIARVDGAPRVGSEARHAASREEGLQRARARQDDVQPEVEFETIDEERVG